MLKYVAQPANRCPVGDVWYRNDKSVSVRSFSPFFVTFRSSTTGDDQCHDISFTTLPCKTLKKSQAATIRTKALKIIKSSLRNVDGEVI